MSLFLRDYRLIVGQEGSSSGADIRYLQIKFSIVRSSKGGSQNKAKFEVYNLSPSTRSLFQTAKTSDQSNSPVILFQTRYLYEAHDSADDGFQTLFSGRIVNAITTKSNADMITQIEASDGYVPLRDGRTSRTFPAGTTRRSVLTALISDLGVPVGEIRDGGSLSQRFENGTTVEGSIKLAITKLLDPVNIDWSIQDDSFTAIRKDLASNESILDLSPQTGLIGSPQARKGRANKIKGSLANNSQPESDHGVHIETLLLPEIRPNRRVRVTSEQFPNGQLFKVEKAHHIGDFRGNDWKTQAELTEYQVSS